MHPHPGFCLHLQTRIHQYFDSPTTTGRWLRPPCRHVACPSTTHPPLFDFMSLLLNSWTLSYSITETINFFNTLSINTLMFFANTSLHHFGRTSSLLQTRTTGILIWLAQTNNLDFTIISHAVSWLYT